MGDFDPSANIRGISLLVRWNFHNRGLGFFPEVPQEVEKAEWGLCVLCPLLIYKPSLAAFCMIPVQRGKEIKGRG